MQRSNPAADIRFLQDPILYHAVSIDDVPAAFLDSTRQPPDGTPLAALLQAGFFRRAATVAAAEILATDSGNIEHIFHLLYTRLACLVLISKPDIAVQEAHPLIDVLSRNPAKAKDLLPRIPWELRLLLVRLESIGVPDGGRGGVMSLYALANEARAHITTASAADDTKVELWKARLADLGLRVSDTLVEMGELETARRHLNTLARTSPDELAYRKALLLIRIGDVSGAQRCLDQMVSSGSKATLDVLLLVANGESSLAVDAWRGLMDTELEHALAVSNATVGSIYMGNIVGALGGLERAVETLPPFPGLLFNLSTVYELCTERGLERKTALMQQLATRDLGPLCGGAERSILDFKL